MNDVMQMQSRSTERFEHSPTLTSIRDLRPNSINWLIRAKVTDLDKRQYLRGNGYVMDIVLQDCSNPVSGTAEVSRLVMSCQGSI